MAEKGRPLAESPAQIAQQASTFTGGVAAGYAAGAIIGIAL